MIESVVKRNKTIVQFDADKILLAILKTMKSLGQEDEATAKKVQRRVLRKLKMWEIETAHVDQIHILVEHALMDAKLYDLAREYITYRDANKPDIFRPRINIKPYEYPQLIEYVDAIRHSYWTHDEFKYSSDVQDIKVNMTEKEREACLRAMLAISQIESAVKEFWGKLGTRIPKPEVKKVGATFADSEVRHEDAYSNLLEILGLNERFETIREEPCIAKRIDYLERAHRNMGAIDERDFFESIILFSMFVENVSLFSQFYVLMSFNYKDNMLKGMSNAIEATSKEENIHAMFGFDLVNIIKEENPDWWDEDLIAYIKDITYDAFEAEKQIVDWIYEHGDLKAAPKAHVIEYIKSRFNKSLEAIGIDPIFGIDEDIIKNTEWFDVKISVTKVGDFFDKRNTTYTKRAQSFSSDNIF